MRGLYVEGENFGFCLVNKSEGEWIHENSFSFSFGMLNRMVL